MESIKEEWEGQRMYKNVSIIEAILPKNYSICDIVKDNRDVDVALIWSQDHRYKRYSIKCQL